VIPVEPGQTGKKLSISLEDTEITLWEWDIVNNQLSLEGAHIELPGRDPKKLNPEDPLLLDGVHPDDLSPNVLTLRDLASGKLDYYETEFRAQDKNGLYIWYYARGKVLARDSQGKPVLAGGMVMDISSRYKGIGHKLEEERKLEFIYKNINEPVLLVKLKDGKAVAFADCNDALARLLGISQEKLQGVSPETFFVEKAGWTPAQINDVIEGRQQLMEMTLPGRGTLIVELKTYNYSHGADDLLIMIISDRTENLLYREKLERSEARFESLFRFASMGIGMLEPDGRIMLANSAFKKVLPEYDQDNEAQMIFDLIPEMKDNLEECFRDIRQGNQFHCTFTPRIINGHKKVWYSITVSAVLGKNKNIDFIIFTLRDITGQKEMEISLKESENLYRTLIEAAEDRIGLFSMDRKPIFMNNAFANILGYSVEEYMQVDEMLQLHPDDRSMLERRQEEFYRKGEMTNEYRIRHKDGHYLCMFSKMVIIKGEGDEEDRILSIVRDVTERQHTIQKLRQSEHRFRQLIAALPDTILQVDKSGIVIDYHFAASNPMKPSRRDVRGKHLEEIFSGTVVDQILSDIDQVLSKEEPAFLEYEYVDGEDTGYFEIRTIYFNEQEVLLIIHDNTYRHLSEVAVRESESKYRALVEAADDRIALYDILGTRILTNSAYHLQLGYSAEEYEKIPFGALLHPDDRFLFKGKGMPLHLIGKDKQIVLEYRMEHKNGYFLDMMAKIVPVSDMDGIISGYLEIVRDITPLKKVEQQLRIAKEKAEESDLLKSAFLANMSHEIRTPMNSIVGFANLLTNPLLENTLREEYVKRINRNSEQLLALISDIIDLAKIESGQLTIVKSRVVINQVMMELHVQFKQELQRLDKGQIKLILENNEQQEDIIVQTDYVRLTQILQNLLNNAIKFTQEGTIRFGYRIVSDSQLLLYVADSGIGIARENYEIIFDQFRQVDGSQTRKFGGTGLGLAICRNLVGLMGGRIWVESELSKGSIFYIELPGGNQGITLKRVTQDKELPEEPDYKKLSIIVVDDNLDTQVLFMSIFKDMGLSPAVAGSSGDLLSLINSGIKPDLILLDIQLPDISGEMILPRIRDLVPAAKVVAQSAFALAEEKDHFLRAGFDAYIAKPFDKEALKGVMAKLFT